MATPGSNTVASYRESVRLSQVPQEEVSNRASIRLPQANPQEEISKTNSWNGRKIAQVIILGSLSLLAAIAAVVATIFALYIITALCATACIAIGITAIITSRIDITLNEKMLSTSLKTSEDVNKNLRGEISNRDALIHMLKGLVMEHYQKENSKDITELYQELKLPGNEDLWDENGVLLDQNDKLDKENKDLIEQNEKLDKRNRELEQNKELEENKDLNDRNNKLVEALATTQQEKDELSQKIENSQNFLARFLNENKPNQEEIAEFLAKINAE